jgi:hypothetical protein
MRENGHACFCGTLVVQSWRLHKDVLIKNFLGQELNVKGGREMRGYNNRARDPTCRQ